MDGQPSHDVRRHNPAMRLELFYAVTPDSASSRIESSECIVAQKHLIRGQRHGYTRQPIRHVHASDNLLLKKITILFIIQL